MKNYELTPGAQRALAFAARWTASNPTDSVQPQELLLGLLEEPECRAALLLAARGIGVNDVRQRWPQLQPADPVIADRAECLASPVAEALLAAELRVAEYMRPVELATEHLLLGLAVGQNEVARWFDERGLDVAALEAEIHRLAGHQTGPLTVEALALEDEPVEERPAKSLSTERNAVWRIIDAAANRAGEGLRVIEDYARFALDDRFLTAQCKSLRHDLAAALKVFPLSQRHAARETQADVGANLSLASEQARSGAKQVVVAGFQRVQQALRSLEEYAKTMEPDSAAQFESLRYRTYTLQRAIDIAGESSTRLADVRLYVLVDGRESIHDFDRFISALVTAGVDVIQLRDKRLPDRELMARARLLREQTRGTQTLYITNDRPDVAMLSQADGIHVGQDELTVKDVRAIVGPDLLVGVSTHSLEQARAAVLDGADYIGVGPTFPSRTKEFKHFPGLELLRQVSGEIRLPAFAVGGITAANAAQVRACGITRIAVSGAVTDEANLPAAVAELRRLLRRRCGWHRLTAVSTSLLDATTRRRRAPSVRNSLRHNPAIRHECVRRRRAESWSGRRSRRPRTPWRRQSVFQPIRRHRSARANAPAARTLALPTSARRSHSRYPRLRHTRLPAGESAVRP